MSPQPALPFTPADLARMRARHEADQQEACDGRARRGDAAALVLVQALLLAFVLTGCYAVAAAAGLAPALPGSALAAG